jgi:hypothetical protein
MPMVAFVSLPWFLLGFEVKCDGLVVRECASGGKIYLGSLKLILHII